MSIPDAITDNPAIWTGLVGAVIVLLTAFGINVTPDQEKAILGFVAAVLAGLALLTHKVTVPKSPSTEATTKSLQLPPQ